MIIWGVNAANHDASISVVDSNTCEILFAGHAERYSRVKNDSDLNQALIDDALLYGQPDKVIWFENPWGRRARYLKAGQYDKIFSEMFPKQYMKRFGITAPIEYSDHHQSHAAGGFYTSGFDEAACVVIDAIGELTTASIWHAKGSEMKKLWSLKYPHSLGLFYSAITDLVGLKPNEEEYILMGMVAYGDEANAARILDELSADFFKSGELKQDVNFHRGIRHNEKYLKLASTEQGRYDLAMAAQTLITDQILDIIEDALGAVDTKNLVYSGGVALNCLANSVVAEWYGIDNFWIMPNPGDAGNSLGAIANYLRKPLKWKNAMLGTNIDSIVDPDAVVDELLRYGVCGVATGRAEFGPRAFGNRSLLGDPRSNLMKDRVNEIKRRQKFRPFAPVVLDRFKHEHFVLPPNIDSIPYMQFVVEVKDPNALPAITHADGTGRLQTVTAEETPVLNAILERWYERTGCPVLLNTSLNIKGEPLVNTAEDAQRFAKKYNVKVF